MTDVTDVTTRDPLALASLAGSLDIDAVRAWTAAVVDEPLLWFPVRHHSPTVSLHLKRALLERRPKVMFLEAPADAASLLPHLLDEKTKPPVAMYVSYRDDDDVLGLAGRASPAKDIPPRFSSWFPLLSYSPEYVAMKTAHDIGCEVVFFDLPRSALLEKFKGEAEDGEAAQDGDEEPAGDDDEEDDDDEARGESWEHLAVASTFYRSLAEAAGYRTWDECWDALFEDPTRHASWTDYRKDLAAFCAAVRATTPPARLERDGTLARERFMMATVRRVMAERGLNDEDAIVVCGGFHLFLDRNDETPPPTDHPGTRYATVTPYSYFRVSEQSGYGAANRAPQWYRLLHDACEKGDVDIADAPVEAMLRHIVNVVVKGRKESEHVSSADAIAAAQHARLLAALRGRKHPVLDDVRDALISCCVKGRPDEEGAHLLKALTRAEVGTAVGRVTPAVGQLPLVHDFYAQIDTLDLGEVMGAENRVTVSLDLRNDDDRRRSVFLHRLAHLDVPLGKLLGEGGSKNAHTLFAEQWQLSWSPRVEDALIEKNLYGDGIEGAAVSLLEEELARDSGSGALHAGRATQRLVRSLNMELPGILLRLEEACGTAIDGDARFVSLADAVSALLLLHRHAERGALSTATLEDLVGRAYGRACFLIPDVASVGDSGDDGQTEVVRGLQSLAETLLGGWADRLDRSLFVDSVKSAASSSTVPFMQGALLGLLSEIRATPAQDLADRVTAYARGRPEAIIQAGPFLDGVMAVSKTSLLLGADALVAAVDELLRAADPDAFRILLPLVRHAFERLHDRQRDALAQHVAERYGLKDAEDVTVLETSSEALLEMARIDQRVAAIMQEWSL